MSEILLNQNISLIYEFIKGSVKLHAEGRHWEALDLLRISGAMIYKKADNHEALDDLKTEMNRITVESRKINATSPETTRAQREDYVNMEAGRIFVDKMEDLRDYMQNVGYYTMMNKTWDNRITPTSTMKAQVEPPKTKTYSEKLASEIL